ncbi:MAG: transporter substrate-binding domain-containing protein [Patescibacteria group bacterium]|nr:transporter substrate-binding domain-containing protein [Patescibacteria group bacterium]
MENKTIKVGISLLNPFVMKSGVRYIGFEIDLWEEIASRLNLKYQYIKIPFKNLIQGLKRGKYEVAFSGITKTLKRNDDFDFCTSYLSSGLLILTRKNNKLSNGEIIKNNILKEFIKIISFIIFVIFAISNFIWFSHKNYNIIANDYGSGIIQSFQYLYYSIIHMSFYDIAPYQKKDILFLILIFIVALIIATVYIIKIIILFSKKEENFEPQSIEDLRGKRVASEHNSTSEEILKNENIKTFSYKNIEIAFKKLKNAYVDAVLYDSLPILHFIKDKSEFKISNKIESNQEYTIAVNSKSYLRGEIDSQILKMKDDGFFDFLYNKWFKN